jgi:hypothetical protein
LAPVFLAPVLFAFFATLAFFAIASPMLWLQPLSA